MRDRLLKLTYKEYIKAVLDHDNERAGLMFGHLFTLVKDKKWYQFWK